MYTALPYPVSMFILWEENWLREKGGRRLKFQFQFVRTNDRLTLSLSLSVFLTRRSFSGRLIGLKRQVISKFSIQGFSLLVLDILTLACFLLVVGIYWEYMSVAYALKSMAAF